jgi:hypothetical protein
LWILAKELLVTASEAKIIHEIETAASGTKRIPAAKVREWSRLESVEVLGAVTVHIMQNTRRVEPPLSMEEICSTVQRYYRECLIQNLQASQYAPNRWIAGHDLVTWFRTLWRDSAVPREYLVRLKTMLRELSVENRIPQDHLIGAVLEHLFETPEIAEFFADWKSEPQLAEAFDRAMEWAKDHQ